MKVLFGSCLDCLVTYLFGGRKCRFLVKFPWIEWKITMDLHPDYKRGKMLRLESSLCLMLGSSGGGGKWILFSVDRVNVKNFWGYSLWMADGVTQLLSTRNLKEIVCKDWLVRSKLLEELNSLSFLVAAHESNSSLRIIWSTHPPTNRPLLNSKRGYL